MGDSLFGRLWGAIRSNAQPSQSGGLTSASAMKKVRDMIDEERRQQQQRGKGKGGEEASPLCEAAATAPDMGPDYVAESPIMIETVRETTDRERAEESRAAQIKTLRRVHMTNIVVSFVVLLLTIVLMRQT